MSNALEAFARRIRRSFAEGKLTPAEVATLDVVGRGLATRAEVDALYPGEDWARFDGLRRALDVIRNSGLPVERAALEMRAVRMRWEQGAA